MKELIFYSRGGQGAVTAARIMVTAALKDGLYAQAVPSFGQERKGAAVYTYSRISKEPITVHTFVYEPDCVVVFDWSLLELGIDIHKGIKLGGILVANLSHMSDNLPAAYSRVGLIDAWAVTRKIIGNVPPNAAMLGALARITNWFSLESLLFSIKEIMPGKKGDLNATCAKIAFEKTVIHEWANVVKREGPCANMPADAKTGAWRMERPIINTEVCVGCGICCHYCPSEVIKIEENKKAQINYVYCKGCGICSTVCPKQAITMVLEGGVLNASA